MQDTSSNGIVERRQLKVLDREQIEELKVAPTFDDTEYRQIIQFALENGGAVSFQVEPGKGENARKVRTRIGRIMRLDPGYGHLQVKFIGRKSKDDRNISMIIEEKQEPVEGQKRRGRPRREAVPV